MLLPAASERVRRSFGARSRPESAPDGGSDMAHTHLYLLGPARVECDGAPVQGFESRKALALLCYLALQGHPRTRGHLAELFWEGKAEERGRGNLNRVLHNL